MLPLVSYEIVAHFDIDKGSVVKFQYPAKMSVPETILAELMLPEGAHLRESDWTFFMLNNQKPDYLAAVRDEMPFSACFVSSLSSNHSMDCRNECSDFLKMELTANMLNFDTSIDDWVPNVENPVTIRFVTEQTEYRLLLTCEAKLLADLKMTSSMNVALLQSGFVSFYTNDGEAVGLHFGRD